ncbi:hypothetical protein D3C74_148370 [compost metagenome]
MGNKLARKHHFLPQFYLSGFTNEDVKNNTLWVLDQTTGTQWSSKPRNIAYRNDFYRIDVPDSEPDGFEKALAQFEAMAAPVIKNLIQSQTLPEGDDYVILINFIALMACRVPSRREVFDEAMSDVMHIWLQMIFQSPEHYESYRLKMIESGRKSENPKTYEEMKQFVNDESRYTISFHNHTHLNNMMTSLNTIIPLFLDRKWSVLLADEQTGYFICSDSPVNLHWTKPQETIWGPGFGLRETDVTVPLNKNILLLGRFEEELPTQYLSRETIAIMNSYTAIDSQRYVYSSGRDFVWYTRNNNVGTTDDLIKAILKNERDDKGI